MQLRRVLGGGLGLQGEESGAVVEGAVRGGADPQGRTEAAIEARVAARTEAKKARQFGEADRLRNELAQAGIVLEDSATGTRWRRG